MFKIPNLNPYYAVLLWIGILAIGTLAPAQAQTSPSTLRFMHYNLLRFGNNCEPVSINQKKDWLEIILNYYQPDVFTVNELAPEPAFEALIEDAAQSYNPAMTAAGFTNEAGSEIVNDLFYNADHLALKGVEILPGAFRDITVYTLYMLGEDSVFLHCIVAHFKAGRDQEDRDLRTQESQTVLDWVAAQETQGPILFMGDLNFDNAGEEGWQRLIDASQAVHFTDPIDLTEDWNGPDFAAIHTQSTRTELPDCGVNGGMDDRFDFFLLSPNFNEKGFAYVEDSYQALGNAGNSFNQALTCTGEGVPEAICNTLRQMSDHLPIVLEVEPPFPLVSSEKNLAFHVDLFPNPFTEHLIFSSQKPLENFSQAILRELTGKVLQTWELRSTEQTLRVDRTLPEGTYLLQLAILRVLWRMNQATVRQVNDALNGKEPEKEVGYTTTLKLMQIMHDKGLLTREREGKMHVYTPQVTEDETQQQLVEKLVDTAFHGSAMKLVMQALGNRRSTPEELDEIRTYLDSLTDQ